MDSGVPSGWRGCLREEFWSIGRELNPRIPVLQTGALASSPPMLIHRQPLSRAGTSLLNFLENRKLSWRIDARCLQEIWSATTTTGGEPVSRAEGNGLVAVVHRWLVCSTNGNESQAARSLFTWRIVTQALRRSNSVRQSPVWRYLWPFQPAWLCCLLRRRRIGGWKLAVFCESPTI